MTNNYDPQELTFEECADMGVTFPSVRMNNGEYRFVVRISKGTGTR